MSQSFATPWLGPRRGYFADWLTQRWVQVTGRRLELATAAWLDGPVGDSRRIGPDSLETFASGAGLCARPAAGAGLMPDFAALAGPGFDPAAVHPRVREFYERTSDFSLDVWSEWHGAFRPFGALLARLFSRRLQQLNVPLAPLQTARGLTNAVTPFEDPRTGERRFTGWVRRNRGTGDVVYVGAYSLAHLPGEAGPCVRVVFPLPNGNASVFMRPSAAPDGSLVLESRGRGFGDAGFYFVVRDGASHAWVRLVRSFHERIRVFVEPPGELRTDHAFVLFGATFLRLHYHLRGPG